MPEPKQPSPILCQYRLTFTDILMARIYNQVGYK
jgi:hypothetical protein